MNNQQIYQVIKIIRGAIQENWLTEDDSLALVLQKNSQARVSISSGRERQYKLLSQLQQLVSQFPKLNYFTQSLNLKVAEHG
ncbi:hypothetical protein [Psychrobacter sanguinis]|uniref:Uncharacterized protein n=1 Tax=Psychrobacter sanguinis TaxID=861445 RepID=A0A844M348_9GAMM|nr:hypothetical protein [Psychrobacter sanguinis]MUG33371.1 hypothetical protein [Psychrobacter sanguinis]